MGRAKQQTRRSISVTGVTYARIALYCGPAYKDGSQSVSGYIEALVKADLDAKGVATVDEPPARRQGTRKDPAGGIFTF